MYYIQFKDSNGLETIGEFTTIKEARLMLKEYNLAYNTGHLYISSRACKAWRNK
jgi:hypothetical protein